MNRSIRWLLALNIALVVTWGLCKVYYLHKASEVMTPDVRRFAVRAERGGVFQQSETERHMTILTQFRGSRTISDDDFEWGVDVIHLSTLRIDHGVFAQCQVLFEWRAVKQWTPAQHEKAFQILSALLNDKDDSVRTMAMQVLSNLKDSRSISCLLPLLDDPKPNIRKEAQKYLARMGYKS